MTRQRLRNRQRREPGGADPPLPSTGGRPETPAMTDRLILTCEHAGNVVPARYRPLFVGHEDLLPTHRGWDPGALLLAREMAKRFPAPLYFEEATRLLVDLNRSIGNPELHSEASRHLTLRGRREILDVYYHPHRRTVDEAVAAAVGEGDR